jgi:hypothetical protein
VKLAREKLANEEPLLFYEANGERYGISKSSWGQFPKIIIQSASSLEDFGSVRVRGVRFSEEGEEEYQEGTLTVLPGRKSDIIAEIESFSTTFQVSTIWRGLVELNDEDWIAGETVDVEHEEFDQRVRIFLDGIYQGAEMIQTMVRPVPILLDLLRARYRWDTDTELFFQDEKGKALTHKFDWEGAQVILFGIKNRIKGTGVIFPGEKFAQSIPTNGQEIWNLVESQIDAKFELKIRNRGLIPCWDDFDFDEEHFDEIIEVVMLEELPPAHPVEHALDRESTLNYRQRREREAWHERHKALERSLAAFFQQSVGTHKIPFLINLIQEMKANRARWNSSVVPD